jgi:hypothetical protein
LYPIDRSGNPYKYITIESQFTITNTGNNFINSCG